MSFTKISDLNRYLFEKHGSGLEEIVVSEDVFNNLMVDASASLKYDQAAAGKYELATNLRFYDRDEPIIITKSVRDKIKETEEQIAQLQDKLIKLKTRTGF